MELTYTKIKESGFKYNIEKSVCGQTEMEYLGLWATHEGFRTLNFFKKKSII